MKASKMAMVKGASVVASLAMITANLSNSAACIYIFHQPKVPAKLRNLKKM